VPQKLLIITCFNETGLLKETNKHHNLKMEAIKS